MLSCYLYSAFIIKYFSFTFLRFGYSLFYQTHGPWTQAAQGLCKVPEMSWCFTAGLVGNFRVKDCALVQAPAGRDRRRARRALWVHSLARATLACGSSLWTTIPVVLCVLPMGPNLCAQPPGNSSFSRVDSVLNLVTGNSPSQRPVL